VKDIRRSAKAVLWFEPAIQAIIPAHRRDNEYRMSLSANNPAFKGVPIHQCLQMTDQKQNKNEVADLMNINSNRYYTVNFLNLYFGRTGTVEFRMAPASNGPDEALAWIEFSTTFTRTAILDWQQVHPIRPERRQNESVFCSWETLRGLRHLIFETQFSGRSKKPPSPLGTMSPEKQALFTEKQRQDQSKNIIIYLVRSTLRGIVISSHFADLRSR
jgi:hypothetical protein